MCLGEALLRTSENDVDLVRRRLRDRSTDFCGRLEKKGEVIYVQRDGNNTAASNLRFIVHISD